MRLGAAAPSKLALLASLLLGFTFTPLASCTTEKTGHSLSLEAVEGLKSSHADHPVPYKSPCQKVPTSTASRRHQREMDHAGHVVRSPNVIISISGAVGMVPVVYCRGTRVWGAQGRNSGLYWQTLR